MNTPKVIIHRLDAPSTRRSFRPVRRRSHGSLFRAAGFAAGVFILTAFVFSDDEPQPPARAASAPTPVLASSH